MSVDSAGFREVMRRYPSGVVVVTVKAKSESRGMTAVSFSSVSLDPPLVSVAVAKNARTHQLLKTGGGFVVNILKDNQQHLAQHFAQGLSGDDQFKSLAHHGGLVGAPILEGCLGYLECRLHSAMEAGDHTIFIGEVERAETGEEGLPLIYFGRDYRKLGEIPPV